MTMNPTFACCLLLCFAVLQSNAQVATEFPGELPTILEYEKEYCKPGVVNKSRSQGISLKYNFAPQFDIGLDSQDPAEVPYKISQQDLWKFKLKIPLANKCNLKLLLGVEHGQERFVFNRLANDDSFFNSLNGERLKSTRFTGYMVKALNEKFYLGATVAVSYNGDYEKLLSTESRYTTYRAAVTLGVKKTEDKEWGLGLYYKNGFRNKSLLPFGFYNRTFNERWGLESVIPQSVFGRYNIGPKALFLFGATFKSQDYSVDWERTNDASIINMRRQNIHALIRLEQQFSKLFWFDLRAGYQFNLKPEFENAETGDLLGVRSISNGPIFTAGIFLSPPKEWIK